MKLDKRKVLRNIRQKWENPEKLLEYIVELDKQEELDIQIAYENGRKAGQEETVKHYSTLFAYSLKIGGAGKKTLPKYLDNIQWVAKQMADKKLTIEQMEEELKKADIVIS